MLYVLEDHALGRLNAEIGHRDGDLHELVDYLRAAEVTVTCDETWKPHPSPTG
jgi:hypothetical protein